MLQYVARGGKRKAQQEEDEEERLKCVSRDALRREQNGAHEFALGRLEAGPQHDRKAAIVGAL